MRGLMRQLRARLRTWLLKEEMAAIDCMLLQSALIVGTGENLLRQNALVLQELEAVRVLIGGAVLQELDKAREGIEVQVQVLRIDAKAAMAETKASVDRLVELVTPKAERLQGRRPVGGWDEVVSQNLQQFEEKRT
jgi:hypothetical protein